MEKEPTLAELVATVQRKELEEFAEKLKSAWREIR